MGCIALLCISLAHGTVFPMIDETADALITPLRKCRGPVMGGLLFCIPIRYFSTQLGHIYSDIPISIADSQSIIRERIGNESRSWPLLDLPQIVYGFARIGESTYIPVEFVTYETTYTYRLTDSHVGIGIDSSFHQFVDRFGLVPGQGLIINPPDPSRLCFENELTPPVLSADRNKWSVLVSVDLVDNIENINPQNLTSSPVEYVLNTLSESTTIPDSVFDQLMSIVDAQWDVVYLRRLNGNYILSNCQLDGLPYLRFTFYSLGSPVTQIILGPDDYMRPLDLPGGNWCNLEFTRPSPVRRSGPEIGANLLRHISVHFDTRTRQMRFCDPPV
jgi:hypothetical protein